MALATLGLSEKLRHNYPPPYVYGEFLIYNGSKWPFYFIAFDENGSSKQPVILAAEKGLGIAEFLKLLIREEGHVNLSLTPNKGMFEAVQPGSEYLEVLEIVD